MSRARSRVRIATFIVCLLAMLGGGLALLGQDFDGRPTPATPSCENNTLNAKGRTFYVDPVRGTDTGDGSLERPWRSLQHTFDAKLIGAQTLEISRLQYWQSRLLGTKPASRLFDNRKSVVRNGDTILLAAGDHGSLDLRGIANQTAITIRGAPGAEARFSSVQIEGASHFTFENFSVTSAQANANNRFLVTLRPEPTARRSDNIVFRNVDVGGSASIAKASPAEWAEQSRDGMLLFGDCLEVQAGTVHDVHNGILLYQVSKAKIEDASIHDFSVDGIAFSGSDIVIRNNVIHDHWPTGDDRHPDCMQGQSAPGQPVYSRILIERNVCLSDTTERHSEIFQGINIFDGEWSDITIRCNFIRPTIWHGISLYGVSTARIENNIVTGWPGINTPWIAAMPSKEQRHPEAITISGNSATGYLNAIHGGPYQIATMFRNLQINPADTSIQKTLSQPITGVTLQGNVWLNASWDMSLDKRFRQRKVPAYGGLVSIDQARNEIAALPGCTA